MPAGAALVRVASIWRTLLSCALMLSRRCVAATSSRSDSSRIRSAWARAAAMMFSDSFCASSTSRREVVSASVRIRCASALVRSRCACTSSSWLFAVSNCSANSRSASSRRVARVVSKSAAAWAAAACWAS